MSSTPRAVGTLIVVILKAKHLPNKRHIGKQSPYCSVSFNGEKRRTKAIKKGGQHPEWDEEVRFTVYGADSEDEYEIVAHPDGTAPPPPPKEEKKGPKKFKGGTMMKLFCFADDPREPDLVGETVVDLTEVFTKGETDEWFTLMYKDKYAGEVYLELTFWSNEPAPEKKKTRKPPPSMPQYGGSGSFVPFREGSITPPDGEERISPRSSTTRLNDLLRHPSDPSSTHLRTSASMAQLDLYAPPYESRARGSSMENLANEFGEIGVHENRRESLPAPFGSALSHRWPQSQASQSSLSSTAYGSTLDRSYYTSEYQQDVPPTSFRGRSVSPMPFNAPESRPPPSTIHSRRSTRYSLPATSSGFMPLASRPSEPSGFLPQHTGYASRIPSVPNGFPPPSHSATPAPQSFTPVPTSISAQNTFAQHQNTGPQSYPLQSTLPQPPGPLPSQSYPSQPSGPISQSYPSQPPGGISQSYSSQTSSSISQSYSSQPSLHTSSSINSFPQSQSYQYYPSYPSTTFPPSLPPPPPLPPSSSVSPRPPTTATPSPPRQQPTPPTSAVSVGGTTSRPLPPQPTSQGPSQVAQQGQAYVHGYAPGPPPSLPPSASYQQHYPPVNGHHPPQPRPPLPPTSAFQAIPPPPPPPLQPQYTQEETGIHSNYHPEPHHSHSMDEIFQSPVPGGGVPPPPPPASARYPARRQSSLPQPPINQGQYHRVSNAYQTIPPPPPPPPASEYTHHTGSYPDPSPTPLPLPPAPAFPSVHQANQYEGQYQEQYDTGGTWASHTSSPIHQAAWS